MANKTFTQFRVDNVVTTLPTTLAYGQEVYYKDANGNLTLWVGHEDGSAWPSVGYKEYRANIVQSSTGIPVATVLINTIGAFSFTRGGVGQYGIQAPFVIALAKNEVQFTSTSANPSAVLGEESGPVTWERFNAVDTISFFTYDALAETSDDMLNNTIVIRVYP
jgi:hypothetical protein